jgi:hypothetical protein
VSFTFRFIVSFSNSSSCSCAPFTSRRAVGGTVIRLGGTGGGAPVDGGAKSNMGV